MFKIIISHAKSIKYIDHRTQLSLNSRKIKEPLVIPKGNVYMSIQSRKLSTEALPIVNMASLGQKGNVKKNEIDNEDYFYSISY